MTTTQTMTTTPTMTVKAAYRIFELLGDYTYIRTYPQNFIFEEPGYIAIDNVGRNIKDEVIVTSDVPTSYPGSGTYTVSYKLKNTILTRQVIFNY
jgi:hypothetical protein